MGIKTKACLRIFKSLIGKLPYIVLGWFFYPFIKRTETREKFHSGKGGWYNRQLWYMINDDELGKERNKGFDFDVDHVEEQGIDYSTKWGQFKASYWFNALRNPAYNYSLYHSPKKAKGEYAIYEIEYSNLTENGKPISPLYWPKFYWVRKDGSYGNNGEEIALHKSRLGKTKVWFHPNNDKNTIDLRMGYAVVYRLLFWEVYELFRIGAFGTKYDVVIKEHYRFIDYKFWRGLTPWKLRKF